MLEVAARDEPSGQLTLNRVSSLSVFPNKYLLLSRSTGKGKMPQTAQYYLQLAEQPHFMERLGDSDEDFEVIAAQDRAKLAREVALTLSVLQRLPYYHANKSAEKVPAMSIINALAKAIRPSVLTSGLSGGGTKGSEGSEEAPQPPSIATHAAAATAAAQRGTRSRFIAGPPLRAVLRSSTAARRGRRRTPGRG